MNLNWDLILILLTITINIDMICRTFKHSSEVKVAKNVMSNLSIDDLIEMSDKLNEKK